MFDRFADYLRWANSNVFESLKTVAPIPDNLIQKFAHILAADEIWLARLLAQSPSIEVWPAPIPLDHFPAWIERNAIGYQHFICAQTPQSLGSKIRYSNSKGERFESQVSDILIHVIAHGNHHRGQIASVIKAMGGTPAISDYVFFTRTVLHE